MEWVKDKYIYTAHNKQQGTQKKIDERQWITNSRKMEAKFSNAAIFSWYLMRVACVALQLRQIRPFLLLLVLHFHFYELWKIFVKEWKLQGKMEVKLLHIWILLLLLLIVLLLLMMIIASFFLFSFWLLTKIMLWVIWLIFEIFKDFNSCWEFFYWI